MKVLQNCRIFEWSPVAAKLFPKMALTLLLLLPINDLPLKILVARSSNLFSAFDLEMSQSFTVQTNNGGSFQTYANTS